MSNAVIVNRLTNQIIRESRYAKYLYKVASDLNKQSTFEEPYLVMSKDYFYKTFLKANKLEVNYEPI